MTHPHSTTRVRSWAGLGLLLAACSSTSSSPRLLPIADAGMDQVAPPTATVRLDGTRSRDPGAPAGTPLRYEWLTIDLPDGSAAALEEADGPTPSFVTDRVGAYVFMLRVHTDGGPVSAPDVVTVTALPFLTVERVIPADGATGVPTSTSVGVLFAAPVQGSTVRASTVSLTTVAGEVIDARVTLSADRRMAVMSPLAPLSPSTRYLVQVGTGVRNLSGQPLAVRFVSELTTADAADVTAPSVLAVDPAHEATGVAGSTAITVTFSEPMRSASLTSGGLSVTAQDGTPLPGVATPQESGLRAVFAPVAVLDPATTYVVRVSSAARDLAGNAATPFTSSFTTTGAVDDTPPAVLAVDPADRFADVDPKASVAVTFSEAMRHDSLGAAVSLTDAAGAVVPGSLGLDATRRVATFVPTGKLAFATPYTLTVGTEAVDLAGNGLAAAAVSRFTTMRQVVELDHFRVAADPTTVTAGEVTVVTVTAKRLDDTTLVDYENVEPVLLSHSGSPKRARWSGPGITDVGSGGGEIAPLSFLNGVARVLLADDQPEGPVVVTVTEQDTGLGRNGSTAVSQTSVTWVVGAYAALHVEAAPTLLIAGTPTNVTISATDALGNLIHGFRQAVPFTLAHDADPAGTSWQIGNSITLGAATAVLPAGSFFGGQAVVLLKDTAIAGPVRVTVTDPSAAITGSTHDTGSDPSWGPGGLTSFTVRAAPTQLVAGAPATLTISARDFSGNNIPDYQNAAPITLTQTGPAATATWGGAGVFAATSGGATLDAGHFANGVATVTLTNTRTAPGVVVTATEHDTSLSIVGSTAATATNPSWGPGTIDHFVVTPSTTSLTAGLGVELTIAAVDAFGNLVVDYPNTVPLVLHQSGSSTRKAWSGGCLAVVGADAQGDNTLQPGCFDSGVARVTLADQDAEALAVTVSELTTEGKSGTSPTVTFVPGPLDHFAVVALDTARVAGQATRFAVAARDANDNNVTSYPPPGATAVVLRTNGSATAVPAAKGWSGPCVTTASPYDGSGRLATGCWSGGVTSGLLLTNRAAEGPISIIAQELDTPLRRSGDTHDTLPSTDVTWVHAAPATFAVTADAAAWTAGDPVTLTATVQDTYGNECADFAYTSIGLTLDASTATTGKAWLGNACLTIPNSADATGSNALTPTTACFAGGTTQVQLINTVAESGVVVTLTDTSAAGGITGSAPPITWTHGALDHFRVIGFFDAGTTPPPTPTLVGVAGASASLQLTAADIFGNVIPDYTNVLPIRLEQNGTTNASRIHWTSPIAGCVTDAGTGRGSLQATAPGGQPCWTGGTTVVRLADDTAEGPSVVTVTESDLMIGATNLYRSGNTGATGSSLRWVPGAPASFQVTPTPLTLVKGDVSTVRVTMLDQLGNPVPGALDAAATVQASCGGCTLVYTGLVAGSPPTIASGTAFDSAGSYSFTAASAAAVSGATITITEPSTASHGLVTGSNTSSIVWTDTGCSTPTPAINVTSTRCAHTLSSATTFSTYAWTVLSAPSGSAVRGATGSSQTFPFTADFPGDYVFQLTVTNGCGASNTVNWVLAGYHVVPAAGDVVINEVVMQPQQSWDNLPAKNDADQWVELRNLSGCQLDLTPWVLQYSAMTSRKGQPQAFVTRKVAFGALTGSSGPFLVFSAGGAAASFRPGEYVIIQNAGNSPANSPALTPISYLQLYAADPSTSPPLIDDVELGDNPRGDVLGNGAPAGQATGATSTGAADECTGRDPASTDSNRDHVDFTKKACTFGAPNN